MLRYCPQLEIAIEKDKRQSEPAYYTDTGCILAEAVFNPENTKHEKFYHHHAPKYSYLSAPICRCLECPFNCDDCIISREEQSGYISKIRIDYLRNCRNTGVKPTTNHALEMLLFPETKPVRHTEFKDGDICAHCHDDQLKADEDDSGEYLLCLKCGFHYDLTDKIGVCSEVSPKVSSQGNSYFGGKHDT